MARVIDALTWLITVRPYATLAVLLVITVGLGAGILRLEPEADPIVFLPENSQTAASRESVLASRPVALAKSRRTVATVLMLPAPTKWLGRSC